MGGFAYNFGKIREKNHISKSSRQISYKLFFDNPTFDSCFLYCVTFNVRNLGSAQC